MRSRGLILLAGVALVAGGYGAFRVATDGDLGVSPGAEGVPRALPPLEASGGQSGYPEGWGGCHEGSQGYSIAFPNGWEATGSGPQDHCGLFHPEPLEVEPGATPAAAMVVEQLEVSFEEALAEIRESEGPEPERVESLVAPAMRFEVVDAGHSVWPDGTRRYGYLFDRGEAFLVHTVALPGEDADYEANRKIIDQAVTTLQFFEVRVAQEPKRERASEVSREEKTASRRPVAVAAAEDGAPASSSEPAGSSSGPAGSSASGGSSRPTGSSRPAGSRPQATGLTFTARSAASGQFSDQTRFEARLTDSGGEPLGGRRLTFRLAGEGSSRTFSATTNGDGRASVTPTLEERPGSYRLTVRFGGSARHGSSSDGTGFRVRKEDTASELAVQGKGEGRTLRARLSDLDSPARGLEGRTIRFFADGELVGSKTTDGDGVAVLEAPPGYRGGKHDFEARFGGDDFYRPSSAHAAT